MVGAAWMAAHTSSCTSGRSVFAPALLLAGVNLTAESAPEPPRGGEHGAGANCLYLKKIIRGIPKLSKIIVCVSHKQGQKQPPLALGEPSVARKQGSFPYIAP